MQLMVKAVVAAELRTELLAIPLESPAEGKLSLPRRLQALDRAHGGAIGAALEAGGFAGRSGQSLMLYPPPDPASGSTDVRRLLLIGMGKAREIDAERLRRVSAAAIQRAQTEGVTQAALLAPAVRGISQPECAAALAEGAILGAYHFDGYMARDEEKPEPKLRRTTLAFSRLTHPASVRAAVRDAKVRAESQNFARDLSNEPGNALPPSALAREARRMARATGLQCRVMRKPELERRGMTALLAVGQGSVNPPHLIVLEHRGGAAGKPASARKTKSSAKGRKRGQTVCLVGKGITFDSGGLSIKPAASMPDMKHDMGGAATVLGAMRAIALLDLPVHVVGVVAAAENMPSGTAYRPGDIIRAMSGKTIEILNTDAEGRLVLADALHYAVETHAPAAMIDVATLTGAAMMAFGPWATAALGTDDDLRSAICEAGNRVGELTWPMPLLPEHRRAMRSTVADLKNTGGPHAGVSTAAAFLAEFVGDTSWTHLDIAGTGFTSTQSPYHRGGGTGAGVRTLVEWLRARCA